MQCFKASKSLLLHSKIYMRAAAAMSSSPAAALQSPLHAPATNPGAQFHRQSRTAARTRFYAHRVRESLPSRAAAFLCSILLTLLLIAGIIVFILWLNLRPHRPRFYLSSFSFPSLSPSSPISFDVSARNANSKIAISYGDVGAAVFYNGRQIASSPAVLSAFYQPPKNTTEIRGQLIATPGAFPGDTMASRVDLRLELNALVQFRLSAWDTHHHELHVSCDLAVGPDGNLLPEFQSERCSVYFG